ncbi:MAG: hypothetical protein Q8P02_00355, partial [Candidatus Micrarchaeota archaeon]|nr:hypothetical protein [Candidatus Micrarchaeota archaeon]
KELSGAKATVLAPTATGDGSHAVRTGAIIQAYNGFVLRIDHVNAPSTGGASVSFTAFNPAGDELSRGTVALTQSLNVAGVLEVAFIGAPKEQKDAALIQVTSLVGANQKPRATPTSEATPQPTATAKTPTATATPSVTQPTQEPLASTLVTAQDETKSPVVAFVDALFAFIRQLFGSE